MSRVTRGFRGRGRARGTQLPPGQYDTGSSWPVLTAEISPRIDLASWTFTVDGLVAQPTTWTWDEIQALPPSTYDGAIHCVTTWSKLDMHWHGVSLDTLLAVATPLPHATHVLAFSSTGYTTNLPLDDVSGGRAWVAFEADGEPLSRDHGGPARLLVPHLCFWKIEPSNACCIAVPSTTRNVVSTPSMTRSPAATLCGRRGSRGHQRFLTGTVGP